MDEAAASLALKRAVAVLKTQARFAKAIGASQQLVSYLVRRGRPLSARYVLAAERATGVSRSLLRPDLYPEAPNLGLGPHRVACDRAAASNAYHFSDTPAGRTAAEAPAALADRSPIPASPAQVRA